MIELSGKMYFVAYYLPFSKLKHGNLTSRTAMNRGYLVEAISLNPFWPKGLLALGLPAAYGPKGSQ